MNRPTYRVTLKSCYGSQDFAFMSAPFARETAKAFAAAERANAVANPSALNVARANAAEAFAALLVAEFDSVTN